MHRTPSSCDTVGSRLLGSLVLPMLRSCSFAGRVTRTLGIQIRNMSTKFDYDFVVIGGGSGGLACAKRAASYGARVAVVEGGRLGGTCVNVGCVPKKVMFNAATVREVIHEAKEFGFTVPEGVTFDWGKLKQYRDRYIKRLNGIYESGLDKLNIQRIHGLASFDGPNTLAVHSNTEDGASETKKITSEHILIAVGGEPNRLQVPGGEHTINSDGFFELETQPKKVAVIGAGYIAVELSGVFQMLGSDTTIIIRKDKPLRAFDSMLSTQLDSAMRKSGMKVVNNSTCVGVQKERDGTFTVQLDSGEALSGFDCVLEATGRHPRTGTLNLDSVGVKTSDAGYVEVDKYQNTTTEGVYALGDVCGHVELTPMAIAAGRRLADRLFGGMADAHVSYENVATVVFSHPPIGTCGLTEAQAVAKYGQDNLKIYNSGFVNLYYGTFFEGNAGDKPISKYKLICAGPEERVVGLHIIGMGSDEVLQGFAVAMKMGATKADFDNAIAIHPTAGEELVTMPTWGYAGPEGAALAAKVVVK